MTRLCRSLFVPVALWLGVLAYTPAAQAAETVYPSAEACIAARPVGLDLQGWQCVSTDGQHWTASLSRASTSGSGFLWLVAVVGIAWSLVPLGIAVALTKRRGRSPGVLVASTLVLGWIGLALVWFDLERASATNGALPEPPG
jgi:hypothetical protein